MVFSNFDLPLLWFSALAGLFFGVYVFYKGDEESSWRDIVGWGIAVYVTFMGLAFVHRFVANDAHAVEHFYVMTSRWVVFIFTIVLTSATLRRCWKCVRKDKLDDLP